MRHNFKQDIMANARQNNSGYLKVHVCDIFVLVFDLRTVANIPNVRYFENKIHVTTLVVYVQVFGEMWSYF